MKKTTPAQTNATQITKFMGPTWGPPGSCRPQMGPCWPHEPCYLGKHNKPIPIARCLGYTVIRISASDDTACHLDYTRYKWNTLLAKKVVTPPLKTIKPMWIELLCFHLAEIGTIWTRDCSPTKSDTTLGKHSMQGQVGSSSFETTV